MDDACAHNHPHNPHYPLQQPFSSAPLLQCPTQFNNSPLATDTTTASSPPQLDARINTSNSNSSSISSSCGGCCSSSSSSSSSSSCCSGSVSSGQNNLSANGDRRLSASCYQSNSGRRDRPLSGGSELSQQTGSSDKVVGGNKTCEKSAGASRSGKCAHSRTSSTSSGDGLLLSVSALARGGGSTRVVASEVESLCKSTTTNPIGDVPNYSSSCSSRNSEDRGVGGSLDQSALQAQSEDPAAPVRDTAKLMGQVEARPDICTSSSEKVAVTANLSLPLPPATERLEPEGIDEADSTAGGFSSSLLAVDKRVFGRLQEELTAAQSELKLKEEEVTRLSRIRDDVEDELQELTASLFQEAHKMVREANVNAMHAEKALAESNMKVDGLQMEVAALKALVITSTPAKPNLHLHRNTQRKESVERKGGSGSNGGGSSGGSAPGTPTKDRLVEGAEGEKKEEKYIDPVLRSEYLQWKKSPSIDPDLPFFCRIYREDINPCLEFPNSELGVQVREAVLQNTLSINPVKEDEELPRECSLFLQPRRCSHKLTLGDTDTHSHYISQLARNRIASVCDFVTYCRYVTLGLVKVHCNEVYWQVMQRRRNMALARLGFVEE